jgi:hypothetical protein
MRQLVTASPIVAPFPTAGPRPWLAKAPSITAVNDTLAPISHKVDRYHAPHLLQCFLLAVHVTLFARPEFKSAILYIPVVRSQRFSLLFNRTSPTCLLLRPTFVYYERNRIPTAWTRTTRWWYAQILGVTSVVQPRRRVL